MLCILVINTVLLMNLTEQQLLLAKRLLEARQHSRMSQQRAADLMGVSRGELTCWESGEKCPTALQLIGIASTYCICTHALLFGVPFKSFDLMRYTASSETRID